MTLATAATLGGLALVDSTSFGTLGIPLWLMLRSRVRMRTFGLFLGTICAFYWVLGLMLTLGATTLRDVLAGLDGLPDLRYPQLILGVALIAGSLLLDEKRTARRRARRGASLPLGEVSPPSRHDRWKARLADGDVPAAAVMAVALGAGLIEAASMLPYLGAIGVITQAHIGPASTAGVLALYVLVMALPATLLLALRLGARRAVEPALTRLNAWIERNSGEMLSWVLGIVGLVMASDAASRLGLVEAWAR